MKNVFKTYKTPIDHQIDAYIKMGYKKNLASSLAWMDIYITKEHQYLLTSFWYKCVDCNILVPCIAP